LWCNMTQVKKMPARCLSVRESTAWHNNQVDMDNGSIMSFDEFVLKKSILVLSNPTGPDGIAGMACT